MLLRRNSQFARLWAARVASLLGDSTATVTLILYLTAHDGRPIAVSMLLFATGVPYLLSPVAGALADRVDQRRIMISSECGQGLTMAAIALLPSLPVLLGLVLLRACLTMLFQPAGRSTVSSLVTDAELPAANGLMGAGGQGSRIVGPAVGGLLYGIVGPRLVLVGVSAMSLVVAWLLLGLARPRKPEPRPLRAIIGETREGLAHIRQNPPVRLVAMVLFGTVLFAALDDVALTFFGAESLGAGEREVGLLYAAPAAGLVCGGLAMGRMGARLKPGASLLVGVGLTSVGLLGTALVTSFEAALVTLLASGAGNGIENASTDTLIHRSVPRQLLGRVFGTVYGGAFVASSIAYLLGGLLLEATSPRWVFALAGAGVLACAALGARGLLSTQAPDGG